MPKRPPPNPSGFFHVTIPLDALSDPQLVEEGYTARPISESEAKELAKRLQKIGRNQLCLCGSGRKFKKCCLGKLH